MKKKQNTNRLLSLVLSTLTVLPYTIRLSVMEKLICSR